MTTNDTDLLRIAFENIITNAVKYTPIEGTIEIRLEKEHEYIYFSVRDNGVGIPAQEQKDIFQRLYRASNVKDSSTQGTGLGLYLVKLIITKMKGKIWFESKEGLGTEFHIAVPDQRASNE